MDGRGLRVGLVRSRFNPMITDRLLQGAREGLLALGVAREDIVECSVPGAVEIPLAAQALLWRRKVDAVVALGAVIRGETSHYEHVCRMTADGCQRVSLDTGCPVAFGVLTCETEEQALSRTEPGPSNKGFEAAQVAVEMTRLLREIPS